MQPTETPKDDPAARVVPTPQPAAAWRVAAIEALPALRLHVTFIDGTSGEVRLSNFLQSPQVSGTVFEPLRDPEFFQQARVDLGAVAWPNGADLAPDAMYDVIRARGHWTVND